MTFFWNGRLSKPLKPYAQHDKSDKSRAGFKVAQNLNSSYLMSIFLQRHQF